MPEVSACLYQAHWGIGIGFKVNTVRGSRMNQPKEGEYPEPGPVYTLAQVHAAIDEDRAAQATQPRPPAAPLTPLTVDEAALHRLCREYDMHNETLEPFGRALLAAHGITTHKDAP